MSRAMSIVLSGMLMLLWALPASAAAIVYSNEAAFALATGATLHPLPTGVNALSITTTDNLLTLLSATGTLHTDWTATSGADRLAGPDMAVSGVESFDGDVAFSADRYAFGFGIYESTDPSIAGCNTACVDSTFEITLLNNGSPLIPSFLLLPADNTSVFWGVHTDFAFDSVQIREVVGSNDNEIFGTFYTGTEPVPEPGTLLLLGGGLSLTRLIRQKRRARAITRA
ncbi:MAG TPA: PEP-CTERM sorting domain-containing protein [Vicinamibacterales bacterium]|nr:PEP-CTERM sorting domain-containing protein [Vicinamibacterales bacterium]